ncbi:hypothetical protein NIES4102_41230 (plasmid) [Chondrocystis sp. NIES-4102]|nr:hypothetical protein NIES4102_41230 [Chondrocystis sp. NIES-4102]
MDKLGLDSFEISIESDIKSIKPKVKKRGYARELIQKLYFTIEEALADGCSFEQVADVLSKRKVKITSSTLKRYHLANRKSKLLDNKSVENISKIGSHQINQGNNVETNSFEKTDIPSIITVDDSQTIWSKPSLTDEDYAEDFNDY